MARMGRPPSNNPKSEPRPIRLDQECISILEQYCKQEGIRQSEGIRRGIKKLAADIKK